MKWYHSRKDGIEVWFDGELYNQNELSLNAIHDDINSCDYLYPYIFTTPIPSFPVNGGRCRRRMGENQIYSRYTMSLCIFLGFGFSRSLKRGIFLTKEHHKKIPDFAGMGILKL
ncbi:MAG: hypothetical protein JW915_11050 [Chitinispirillaceae bacterium]|nr:hypothetical protein [Chitinispirillaceae bacterium]